MNTKQKFVQDIYEKFYARLFGFGLNLTDDGSMIEDCIQETFKRLQNQDIVKFNENDDYLQRWLFIVFRNFIFKRKAKVKKEILTEPSAGLFESLVSEDLDPSEIMQIDEDTKELYKKLHKAIASLSTKQKKLIKMKYFSGMKHREIAEKLNTKIGNVGFVLQYAVKKLQEKFTTKSLTLK
jgi:RNA polymerase sigma-70 factor (ECF subfamily)